MAKLSKVDAAKAAGVSRQTLYTYIKDGPGSFSFPMQSR